MKQRSIDSAVNHMQAKIDRTLAKLEELGWDSNALAPYPHSQMSRADYMAKQNWYYFVQKITQAHATIRNTNRRNDPHYVQPSPTGIQHLLEDVAKDAALAFDAYVYKLTKKVGDVETAQVTTPWDLWMDSNLRITKADGTVENWNTKCITNYSKYNKAFNQFPTRKTK
jgi:hypothetical protein